MSVSVRPLLTPTIALATAGAIALAPALVAPPSSQALANPVVAVPNVHIENVQLAGIGQNIYNAITPWVQYGVSLVSYGASGVPVIGPPISDQININYFQGIQPAVAATVNYAAGVVAHPLNFFPTTAAYGNALFSIGYYYVSAQLQFFGLPPLPPIVRAATAAAAPATFAAADIPASVKVGAIDNPVQGRVAAQVRIAVTSASAQVRHAASAAASEVPDAVSKTAQQAGGEVRSAVTDVTSHVHTAATSAKSEVRTAAEAARASVRAPQNNAD